MADVRLRDLNPAEFNYGVNVAGSLGVGTTSPAEKLHVNGGDIIVENNSSTTVDLRFRENGSDMLGLKYQAGTSANPLDIYNFNTSTTLLRVDENGKVGIGTSSPSDLLTVGGGTGSASITINKSDAGTAALEFEVGGTDKCYLRCNASEELILGTDDSDRVTIDTAGRVGIGTTGPQNELHVAGSSTVLQLQSSTDTVKVQLNNSGGNACFYGSQNDNLFFQTNSTNRMFITSAGNVGIGTTVPTDGDFTGATTPKLHVVGPSTSSAYHLVARFQAGNDADNTGASILINHSNDRGLLIEAGRASSDRGIAHFGIITSGGVNRRTLTLHDDGGTPLVGIGTDNPEETLHVNGNLKVTGTVDVGSSGFSVSSGFILPFGGGTAPSGWLECDGAAVSRSTYSDLFAIIGTIYGAGDGSTTFNVPDLQGRVIMSQGGSTVNRTPADLENIGDTFGSQTHSLQVSELPSHNHTATTTYNPVNGSSRNDNTNSAINATGRRTRFGAINFKTTISNTGGNEGHNNIQPSIVINYLIKT